MGDRIGVAVPGETALAFEANAPEDERAFRVVAEGVNVEADPDERYADGYVGMPALALGVRPLLLNGWSGCPPSLSACARSC